MLTVLKDYENEPLKYAIPKELYIGKYHSGKIHTISYLPESDVHSEFAKRYYKQKLADEPDLLCVAQVSELTGYHPNAVNRWCNAKKLQYISMHPRTWITKASLYEFMLSDDYNNIPHKSEQHIFDLTLIYKMNHKGG